MPSSYLRSPSVPVAPSVTPLSAFGLLPSTVTLPLWPLVFLLVPPTLPDLATRSVLLQLPRCLNHPHEQWRVRTGRLSVPGEDGQQGCATPVHPSRPCTCLSVQRACARAKPRPQRAAVTRGTCVPMHRGTHLARGVPSGTDSASRLSFLSVKWDDWTFLMGLLWDFGVNTCKARVKTFNACAQPRYSRTGTQTHIPRLHIRTYTHSNPRARSPSSVPAPLVLTHGYHGHIHPDTHTHLHTAGRTSFVSMCLQTVPLVTQSRSHPTPLRGPHSCPPTPPHP